MAKPRLPDPPFTLGRAAFERISAVEGVALDAAGRRLFERFEREALPDAERRFAVLARHSPAGMVHVLPEGAGWQVRQVGGAAPGGVFPSRIAAVDHARRLAEPSAASVVVHGRDRRVATRG